jgi:hypothetical protein
MNTLCRKLAQVGRLQRASRAAGSRNVGGWFSPTSKESDVCKGVFVQGRVHVDDRGNVISDSDASRPSTNQTGKGPNEHNQRENEHRKHTKTTSGRGSDPKTGISDTVLNQNAITKDSHRSKEAHKEVQAVARAVENLNDAARGVSTSGGGSRSGGSSSHGNKTASRGPERGNTRKENSRYYSVGRNMTGTKSG